MSQFLRKLLISPLRSITKRRSSTATPKSNSAPSSTDEYPFIKKYSPIWGPLAVVLVLNTLLAQDESVRDYVEGIFPSYVGLVRKHWGFEGENLAEKQSKAKMLEEQNSDVRLIVEIPGGSKEELVVNGKMLSGELLLKLKTMFNVDSLTVVTFPDAEPTQERVEGAKYVDPADQYFAEPSLTNVLQYFRSMWDVREDYYERSKLTNLPTAVVPPPPVQPPNVEFIPSSSYIGSKSGYVFTTRDQGVGYYLDKHVQKSLGIRKFPLYLGEFRKYSAEGILRYQEIKKINLRFTPNSSTIQAYQNIVAQEEIKRLDDYLQWLLTSRLEPSSHMSIDRIDEDIDLTRREISRLKRNVTGGWIY